MGSTLGIDLSSQPKHTALCAIEWHSNEAHVVALLKGADQGGTPLHDKLLVSAMRGLWGGLPRPAKVAIDAPLGWPVDFVQGVSNPDQWPVTIDDSRKRLERRATDHWVHHRTGKQPLSVTTDRVAYAAMRAAGILSHFSQTSGEAIDRAGLSGLVCETYPDPAIRGFGLWPQSLARRESYKGAARAAREAVVKQLTLLAPWLGWTDQDRGRCIESDDYLDALICALVARAVEQERTMGPTGDLVDEARSEGWIHIPEPGSLGMLLTPA
jgi:predicted RNase H-like nuclease